MTIALFYLFIGLFFGFATFIVAGDFEKAGIIVPNEVIFASVIVATLFWLPLLIHKFIK